MYINHTFFVGDSGKHYWYVSTYLYQFLLFAYWMYKTDNPRLYGTAALLLLNAVAIGVESCAADDAGKKVWVFQLEKMSRSDRLITYEWKTAIFGKHSKEFKELSHAKRALAFRLALKLVYLFDSTVGCFCLYSIIGKIAQRCITIAHQKKVMNILWVIISNRKFCYPQNTTCFYEEY